MRIQGPRYVGIFFATCVIFCGGSYARAQTLPSPAPAGQGTAPPADEATEINKELSNPISSIWALQIQENTYFIHPGIEDKSSRNSVNVQFQPVLPLALTDDWNLITRPVFQVVNSVPVPTETGRIYQATGLGDTILATLLSPSPKVAGPWLLGAGPTFIFPTQPRQTSDRKSGSLGPVGFLATWVSTTSSAYSRSSGSRSVETGPSRPAR